MHIDHQQLLDLLAEASGLDAETTEKQLNELIADIKQSLSDDEAYEIEGFGIFSSLGNRIMFIPSKELETEINFKYVGMEPIELDEPTPSFDDPFEGLDDESSAEEIDLEANKPVGKDLGTRFAGLIDDDINDPDLEPAEDPGPEMWGVEAHKEDESADRLFASLMGEDYEKPIEEDEGIDTSDEDEFDGFDDVFADADQEEANSNDLGAEVAAFMGGDSDSEQNDEKDTDELLDDVFAEMESDGLLNDDMTEETLGLDDSDAVIDYAEVPQEDGEDDYIAADLNSISAENEAEKEEPEEEEPEPEDNSENDLELEKEVDLDFEDPFMNLEDDQVDESVLRMEEFDDTEIVPVIKNITTDDPTDTDQKAETTKEPEEKETKTKKKEKPVKASKNSEAAPAWLWVVLIVVVLGGGVVGLGYFNILNIPFISPSTSTVATTSQPATPPPVVETTPAPVNDPVSESPTETSQTEEPVTNQEQAAPPIVENTQPVQNQTSNDAEKYGLTGSLSADGMDGYTIVMYSLSNQQNALSEQQKLQNNGYRAIVAPIESERYGTLWRVSLGQFASLFDAAVAAEEIETLLPDNYFIKKIN
ncbi:MAG: SPOR domain-containing protein [bacterium]|nr:SPOR domain-containing protein [bacterium]